eukprot:TRINITY_DN5061_c0_g1_i1.p1 TRINITY_DN5061_c0_g1~~TRINITY_DN5061_c0_g1_i1.p1  ORF type:complete len:163 (+),score=26.82 TRINITY_DN5061_c0_g1_i1:106-594(+)
MKALLVILISVLQACSSHTLHRPSSYSKTHLNGQRQRFPIFGQRLRTGRDSHHHPDEAENEIRSAPSGYLPAASDYDYEDQAETRNDDLAGYGDDDLSGYGSGDGQAGGEIQPDIMITSTCMVINSIKKKVQHRTKMLKDSMEVTKKSTKDLPMLARKRLQI